MYNLFSVRPLNSPRRIEIHVSKPCPNQIELPEAQRAVSWRPKTAAIYLGIRAGLFYPFAEPAQHFLAINAFAAIKSGNALQHLRFQFFKGLGRAGHVRSMVFLETAQTRADNFTGSLIQAALDFSFHKLCQFRRKRYVHMESSIKFISPIFYRITGTSQFLLFVKLSKANLCKGSFLPFDSCDRLIKTIARTTCAQHHNPMFRPQCFPAC